MLTKVRIKNYLSFRNETTIDLYAKSYKILEDTNVYHDGNHRILKGLLFVGGNASGKTNLITSLKVLLELLFKDGDINLSNYTCLLCEDSEIELEYEFMIDQNKIVYQLYYCDQQERLKEKLFLNDKEIINRIGKEGSTTLAQKEEFNDLDNKVLFLRYIYFNTKFTGNEILKKWFLFLENSVYLNAYYKQLSGKSKQLILQDYIEKNGITEINDFFEKFNFDQQIEYTDIANGGFCEFRVSEEKKNIFFKRRGLNLPVPIQRESLGNVNLLNMFPSFFHVIKNGGILIIDKFSSGFHNALETLLIKYFNQFSNNAQIIFVSHSTHLLSNHLLRPDQLYSVDFRGKEGSHILRFSDEGPREAQNLEKMYLSGVFDGLPEYEDSNK